MKKKLLLCFSLFFLCVGAVLLYAALTGELNKGQIFLTVLLALGGGFYPFWEFYKAFLEAPNRASFEIHKDLLIIYTNPNHHIEIDKSKIKSFSFETDYSLKIKVCTYDGEIFLIVPTGIGLQSIAAVEDWYGTKFTNTDTNIPYQRLLKLKKFF